MVGSRGTVWWVGRHACIHEDASEQRRALHGCRRAGCLADAQTRPDIQAFRAKSAPALGPVAIVAEIIGFLAGISEEQKSVVVAFV